MSMGVGFFGSGSGSALSDPWVTLANPYTPLHHAAQFGHLDVLTLLLKSGANADIRTRNDAIPLDLAHHNGRPGVARVLSEWMGIVGSQASGLRALPM